MNSINIFLLTYCTYVIAYVSRRTLSVIKTFLEKDLMFDEYALGMLDLAFSAPYAVFQIILPSLTAKCGERVFLTVCLMCCSLACLSFSLSFTFRQCFANWFIQGIAQAPLFALLIGIVSQWFSSGDKPAVMGLWVTSQQLGGVIATILATLFSSTLGWRCAMFVSSVLTISNAVFVYKYLPDFPDKTTVFDTSVSIELFPPQLKKKSSNVISYEVVSNNHESATTTTEGEEQQETFSGCYTRNNQSMLTTYSKKKNLSDSFRIAGTDYYYDSCSEKTKLQEESQNTSSPLQQHQKIISEIKAKKTSIINKNAQLYGTHVQIIGKQENTLYDENHHRDPSNNFTREIVNSNISEEAGVPADYTVRASSSHVREKTPIYICQLLSVSEVLLCSLSYMFVKLVRYTLLSWLPFFLTTKRQYLVTSSGYITTCFDLGGLFGCVLTGQFLKRYAPNCKVFTALCMCFGSGCLLILFAWNSTYEKNTNWLFDTALLTLIGFSLSGPDTVLGSLAASDICDRHFHTNNLALLSTANGIINGLASIGMVIQGYTSATFIAYLGWFALFLSLALSGSIATLLLVPIALTELQGRFIKHKRTSEINVLTV